jgi:MOSC domain-containing protein YiiM
VSSEAGNQAVVAAVSSLERHHISKQPRDCIKLLAGLGVENDAHAGVTVQHRSRVARDPTQPNLRQVHLIHGEFYDELRAAGFEVNPGALGENITTRGVPLLSLPANTELRVGAQVLLRVTGLRNPCGQLNGLQAGLMDAALDRDEQGELVRKAGIMAIVLEGGAVRPGDPIAIVLQTQPHVALEPV